MDMYTDVERSIQQALTAANAPIQGLLVKIFNNQVSKADYPDAHGAISIMKVSDVYQPANGGSQASFIRTPVYTENPNLPTQTIASYQKQPWPDPFDLVYALTVTAETVAAGNTQNLIPLPGIKIVRAIDSMIRSVFLPRRPMYLWDSSANGGDGAWTKSYVNYVYAGYINRDSPPEELYNRVTNIRFEAFNYSQPSVSEPAITQPIELTIDPMAQS